MRKKLWRVLLRVSLFAVGILLLYQLWIFLHVLWWTWINPSTSAFMSQRLEVMQEKNPEAKLRHKWVEGWRPATQAGADARSSLGRLLHDLTPSLARLDGSRAFQFS